MHKKRVFQPSIWNKLASFLTPMLLTALVVANIYIGLEQTAKSANAQSRRVLDEGLRKAVARCYATEGSYPPNLEYIEKYYGVRVDKEKYVVFYEIFAGNVMPNIIVIELAEQEGAKNE